MVDRIAQHASVVRIDPILRESRSWRAVIRSDFESFRNPLSRACTTGDKQGEYDRPQQANPPDSLPGLGSGALATLVALLLAAGLRGVAARKRHT